MGVLLTMSAYTKINKTDQHPNGSVSVAYHCYNGMLQNLTTTALSNFKLIHCCILGFFIFANLVRWTLFGKLSDNEVKNLKDKISYTIWEFWFGFFIFVGNADSQISRSLIHREFMKYCGLFFCIVMLKSFHFICADRAYSVSSSANFGSRQFKRLGFGVLVINLIDLLLMVIFIKQMLLCFSDRSLLKFEDNILVGIFGFEIFQMYPLVFFTGIKFALNHYEAVNFSPESSRYTEWRETKARILNLVEFAVNFTRFSMSCVFGGLFLYFFSFPYHILPSSYLSLRLLIIKTRCLISFERRNIKLRRLNLPSSIEPDSKCIICLDYLNNSCDGVRCLNYCEHNFHYSCLKSWLECSNSCPVCRVKI